MGAAASQRDQSKEAPPAVVKSETAAPARPKTTCDSLEQPVMPLAKIHVQGDFNKFLHGNHPTEVILQRPRTKQRKAASSSQQSGQPQIALAKRDDDRKRCRPKDSTCYPLLDLCDLQHELQSCLALSKHDFNPDYHFMYTSDHEFKRHRGCETFRPPIGWAKLALNLSGLYDSDEWLHRDSGWPVVYHGTDASPAAVKDIIRCGFRIRGGYSKALNGQLYGEGVYVSDDIETSKSYCREHLRTENGDYYFVFQCRVRPGSYEKTTDSRSVWRVPCQCDVRPCGILLALCE